MGYEARALSWLRRSAPSASQWHDGFIVLHSRIDVAQCAGAVLRMPHIIEVFMRPLRLTLAAGVVASFVFPGLAYAKAPKNANASPAATLLAEGRRLMAAGNFTEACPKIAESQSQAPSPMTAMTLASCYQKAGKLATAWATYRAAADSASSENKKKIAATAKRLSDGLEPKLSRLRIKVEDGSGVTVQCDGEAVQESDLGTPVPRDGGGHDIEASAAGKKTWKKHVELAESGQTLEVDVPRLQSETPEPVSSSESSPTSDNESSAGSDSTSRGPSRGTTQRIVGVAIGGLGVAAAALGAYAGLHANSTYNDAIGACGGSTACTSPNGLSLRNSASTWATVSTVSFVIGGAALAGGAVLFFTAPHDHDAQAPAVGVGPASLGTGVSLVGRF